jgi:sarcosine oxidase subunit beta
MKRSAEVVIVGGGISGLTIAYHLAKMGHTDVVVVERRYLGYGATGRCGGGIRQQWSTEENIVLARESVRMWERLEEELGYPIYYRQGGYLVTATTEEEVRDIKRNIKLQNSLGVPSRWMEADEIKEEWPWINTDFVIGGSFCPTDGKVMPPRVVWAYARKLREMGVRIYDFTEVRGVKVEEGKIRGVITDKGEIETGILVNAAGAWSREIARMVGVELPNTPYRHEIAVTEPLKYFLEPMVINFRYGIYFTQTWPRTEIVGGIGNPEEKPGYNMRASPGFLNMYTKVLIRFMPCLRHVKIERQWAGLYDVTPDARPILGDVDGYDRFIQAHGYSGHGLMISPMVGKLIAELIVDGKTSLPIDSLNLRRFEEGKVIREANVVG